MPEPIEQTLKIGAPASREQLLALVPGRYLAGGFRDERGEERPELTALWALAAAEQLLEAGVNPGDFENAASVAVRALDAPPPGPGGSWDEPIREALDACTASPKAKAFMAELLFALKNPADIPPLAHHTGAVLRLLALKKVLAGASAGAGAPPK
ncbi:MAG TPA: hypothetical protein VFB81_07775 [Myxococcales bacterium]|nr:hypothetical protein [Myxococcales bacterium]